MLGNAHGPLPSRANWTVTRVPDVTLTKRSGLLLERPLDQFTGRFLWMMTYVTPKDWVMSQRMRGRTMRSCGAVSAGGVVVSVAGRDVAT